MKSFSSFLNENIFHVHTAHRIWNTLVPHIKELQKRNDISTKEQWAQLSKRKWFQLKRPEPSFLDIKLEKSNINAKDLHRSFPNLEIHFGSSGGTYYRNPIHHDQQGIPEIHLNTGRLAHIKGYDYIHELKPIFIHEYSHFNDDQNLIKLHGNKIAKEHYLKIVNAASKAGSWEEDQRRYFNEPGENRARERELAFDAREIQKTHKYQSVEDLIGHIKNRSWEDSLFFKHTTLKNQQKLRNYLKTLIK